MYDILKLHISIRKKQFRGHLIKFPLLVELDKGNVSKYQLSSVLDSNLQWDIEVHGLEIYVAAIYYRRYMGFKAQFGNRSQIYYEQGYFGCKSLFYSETVFLEIDMVNPPQIFPLERFVSLGLISWVIISCLIYISALA